MNSRICKYITVLMPCFGIATTCMCQQQEIFTVQLLFDFTEPNTLGRNPVPGAETITIHTPGPKDNTYNNGVVLYPFQGMLYAMWQTSARDEDSDDTHVSFSRSANGLNWEDPKALTAVDLELPTTSGGWWASGDTLIAFINAWPPLNGKPRQGFTYYMSTSDGIHWSAAQALQDAHGDPIAGIIEQDLHALPDGRLITAFHMQPGLIATPYYTDDPLGTSGWNAGKMQHLTAENDGMSRELEPSWFYQSGGPVVMIFRDQGSSYRTLASVSRDRGQTWTKPIITELPDSRSKQCAGNLPGGTAYIVNNPSGNKDRYPLVITLSDDGQLFNNAFLLRSGGDDLQPLRYPGTYKRPGYSYPKSVVWKDHLYVSYATNKEDVQLTRVPLRYFIKRR